MNGKRWIHPLLVLLCVFALAAAAAEQPSALPAEVTALCAERYPGYTVSAWDGGGGDTRGQFALALSRDGHNVLCIAEKAEGEAAYTFTVENDRAVRQGADIPSLLIDTGGDSLYYSYRDSDVTYSYHANKSREGWNSAGIIIYRFRNQVPDRETHYFFQDHCLGIAQYHTDENDNITSSVHYLPVSAPWLEEKFTLSGFDIALLPDDNLFHPHLTEIVNQAILAALPDGYDILQSVLTPYALIAEVRDAGGARTAVLLESGRDGAYRVTQSTPMPENVTVDLGHSWSGLVVRWYPDPSVQEDYAIYGFSKRADGLWYLDSAMVPDSRSLTYTLFGLDNLGVWYAGTYTARELTAMDWYALPPTFAQALTTLDQSGWARVISDDPADRLHLRAAPERGAESLGKYYQGTPVRVLGTRGEWTEVNVFGVHGYMMTKWLVFGTDMNGVDNAFIQLTYRGDALEAGIGVYASPFDAGPAATLRPEDSAADPVILGVVGEEWYHVLFEDLGLSGYIRQAVLWPGNG